MTEIYNLQHIKNVLKKLDPIESIASGFVKYSQGKAVIPPVGELLFENPPGTVSPNASNAGKSTRQLKEDCSNPSTLWSWARLSVVKPPAGRPKHNEPLWI